MSKPLLTQTQFIEFVTNLLDTLSNLRELPLETPEQLALYGASQVDINIVLTRLMNSGTEQKVVEAALVLVMRAVAAVGLE